MMELGETLKELRDQIKNEVAYIDKKPYSHNIIGLCLSSIDEHFGKEEANKVIKDFKLDKKGWSIIK